MKSATLALKGALTGAALMTLATTSSAFAAEKVVATNLEPDHHVILENQYVTVMRVMIRPGQSTLFHEPASRLRQHAHRRQSGARVLSGQTGQRL
ncbi:hypothetical protein [Rouxiella chamberiensis]|uniref:Uncharacterized protein n=1 Tax=Rouxiella chamberiensis TaxID=1513468 RepID=A0ABY7HRT6_9GAMM|nr:hypothetical protein [Rouxiella chamberiensis]WAT02137.1 hypothetical protein O1V66_05600 [Rouxiella chamberiensis]